MFLHVRRSDSCNLASWIAFSVNPIWTLQSGSLFILSVTPEVFFGSALGLCFTVKDYDIGTKNDVLGKVFVSQDDLLNGNGERKEFELVESSSNDPKRPVSCSFAVFPTSSSLSFSLQEFTFLRM